MLIVGYEIHDNTDVWVGKNSFGPGWGTDGLFYVECHTGATDGVFGIETYALVSHMPKIVTLGCFCRLEDNALFLPFTFTLIIFSSLFLEIEVGK